MCGEFLIVGGRDNHVECSSAIYQLWNDQFVEVGHLSVGRRECLVVTPSPHEIMVVGGSGWFEIDDTMEEFSVV